MVVAEEFKDYLCSVGVNYCTAPYHPATSVAVERLVKRVMKMGKQEHEPCRKTLNQFLQRYCNMPHPFTRATPAELFLKRSVHTLWKPCYKDIVRQQQQEKQKSVHDGNRAKDQRFQMDQEIVARDYRQGKPRWSKDEKR